MGFFSSGSDISMSPPRGAAAVTPHATNPIAPVPRGIFVGTGGNITGRLIDDSADTVWKNIPSGTQLGGAFQYIRASGTTAADILALY